MPTPCWVTETQLEWTAGLWGLHSSREDSLTLRAPQSWAGGSQDACWLGSQETPQGHTEQLVWDPEGPVSAAGRKRAGEAVFEQGKTSLRNHVLFLSLFVTQQHIRSISSPCCMALMMPLTFPLCL